MIVRAGVMEGRLVREMQLVRRPAMKQGDLLLASAAILHGGIGPPSGRLLSCSFISLTAPPSVGSLATPALSRGTTVATPREPPRYRWKSSGLHSSQDASDIVPNRPRLPR